MYGADLAEFSNLQSSAQACFALMIGGGDFGRMQTVTENGTTIFYWSWIVLGLLIIMNLVIAILEVGHERAAEVIFGENGFQASIVRLDPALQPSASTGPA